MLPDIFSFLETSRLAPAMVCAPTVPRVLLWLSFPGLAGLKLSSPRAGQASCLALHEAQSEHMEIWSWAITQPSFATHPQNISNDCLHSLESVLRGIPSDSSLCHKLSPCRMGTAPWAATCLKKMI